MKRVCFVQCHYTDLSHLKQNIKEPSSYCVERIKRSGLFDEIFLAAADIPQNKIFYELAKEWGIKCYLGSGNNIVERMRGVAQITKCDILTRVLLWWNLVDIDVIRGMIEVIEQEQVDYVNVPLDFEIKFGADILTAECLDKITLQFEKDRELFKKFRFRPWFYLEDNPQIFKTSTFKNVPTYNKTKVAMILKNRARKMLPEGWSWGVSYETYEFIKSYVKQTDKVLDIACGYGYLTYMLSKAAGSIIGIDRDPSVIQKATEQYQSENLRFEVGEAETPPLEKESLDKVVCIHTLEHLKDDSGFIGVVRALLTNGGLFIVEVPLLRKRPLGEPLSPFHYREYSVDNFQKLLEQQFEITELWGVNRGIYCEISKARDAGLAICKK